MCRFLGYLSAKERKALVKLLKGRFSELICNNVCYLFVARLLLVCDLLPIISVSLNQFTFHNRRKPTNMFSPTPASRFLCKSQAEMPVLY